VKDIFLNVLFAPYNFNGYLLPKIRKLINIRPNIMKKPFRPVNFYMGRKALKLLYRNLINVEVLLHHLLKEHFEVQNLHRALVYYNRKPNGKHEVCRLASYHEHALLVLSILML